MKHHDNSLSRENSHMDITTLYKKKKYLIQNLFHGRKKKLHIDKKNIPLPQRGSDSCFFFPVDKSNKFFKVVKLKNIVTQNKKQSLYQKISFNTQNSLNKKNIQCELDYPGKSYRKSSVENRSVKVFSPLTGLVIKILQKSGHVEKNDTVLVIDAMKMENKILSPRKGKLILSNIKEGMSVKTGELLFTIEGE